MPFGIASAPEIFQERMCSILSGLDGVEVSMDDILIHGSTIDILEKRTSKVLSALNIAGLKLNKDKCIFKAQEIKFLGHIVSGNGFLPDPTKIEAIQNLKQPSNVAELQRYLGMVTYLGKFINNFSKLTEPLRKLLNKGIAWVWDFDQKTAYKKLNEALASPPLLRYFDPKLPITLSVDASSHSVASVLLQENQPVAYSSKSLTKTQQSYSQLEKEALAISVAYTLSRDCINQATPEEELSFAVDLVISMPKEKLKEAQHLTEKEAELSKLKHIILSGWPEEKSELPEELYKYWNYRDSYSGFYDIVELKSTTSSNVITELKKWFSVHGIPETLLSDGGTQFNSFEFKHFEKEWQFNKRVSSPLFARSNGLAERYVQEAKLILKKCLEEKTDVYLALLHQRNIPRKNLGSPAQRLMGRRTRTLLPSTDTILQPKIIQNVHNELQKIREKSRQYSNRTKKNNLEFEEGEKVLYRKEHRDWQPATVVRKGPEPRSYLIETPDGNVYRRNSWFLKKRFYDVEKPAGASTVNGSKAGNGVKDVDSRKSSRRINPPKRLDL
ncbi:uncharacterized protein K02A2.6-like [Macrosteles quadrilineatus]|uniref:uncharacterized protein K02A2.6-like n=1 Tax=Macrosteles quadrilineatus TaxID=74068 RepID=UPI0023E27295|nr:uncharacterized protein K02A2.6-like [Macrosteles quadrilineatus]